MPGQGRPVAAALRALDFHEAQLAAGPLRATARLRLTG